MTGEPDALEAATLGDLWANANLAGRLVRERISAGGGPAPVPLSQLPFDTASHGETYWSRAVSFAHGDSTHFRLYVAIVLRDGRQPQVTDSTRGPDRTFAACETIARASDVRWIKRAGDPGDEETLPVWSRVP